MADISGGEKRSAAALRDAENRVGGFINGGGTCTQSVHAEATTLERLIAFKLLRIHFPHQSSALSDLDTAIRKELRRIDGV
jgi:hypothetical protein